MIARWRISCRFVLLSSALFAHGMMMSCTVQPPPTTPPPNYMGPIAERPTFQRGDYWVYERGNLTRVKTVALAANVSFPLWLGRQWSFAGTAVPAGQPATSPTRIPTTMDCHVVGYRQIEVPVGSFEAFVCECACTHIDSGYEPGCGQWTIWYAPEVKNVVKLRTGGTESSLELIEYKASRPAPGVKQPPPITP